MAFLASIIAKLALQDLESGTGRILVVPPPGLGPQHKITLLNT